MRAKLLRAEPAIGVAALGEGLRWWGPPPSSRGGPSIARVKYGTAVVALIGSVALSAAAGSLTAAASEPISGPGHSAASTTASTPTRSTSVTSTAHVTTRSSSFRVQLLYSSASPLTGVVEVVSTGTAHRSTDMYVTHNFSTFSPITVPTPPTTLGPLSDAWVIPTVAFPTPTVGYLVDENPAAGAGPYLFKTSDGGRTWRLLRKLTGGADPGVWMQFVSASVGWVSAENMSSDAPGLHLRTTDGGATWVALPKWSGTPVFENAETGFSVFSRAHQTRVTYVLYETTNGGATWSPLSTLPIPSTALFARPEIEGTAGVLPLVVPHASPSIVTSGESVPVTVVFDTSADGGRSWKKGPSLTAAAVTGLGTVRSAVGSVAAGPAAAAATPTNWWVITTGSKGKLTVRTTGDAGSHWRTVAGRGLPPIHVAADLDSQVDTPIVLTAVNDQIAVVTVTTSPTSWHTYVTTDGGADWSPLTRTP